ncbi:MAG: hypothetical protein HY674_23400 [Chloroflexi bacterium]|nr:hypothetical protein [Chloroflexota bacterium]
MRRFGLFVLILSLIGQAAGVGLAAEYRLTNGDVLKGEAASFNDDGLIVRLDLGGFSQRVGWGRLTQEALKELAKDPRASKFVEPFIEIPPEVKHKEKAKKKEIVLRPVPRVERPAGKPKFFASLITPPGLMVLIVLFLANLYAGYEIAQYRNRPVAMVCGLSVIAPVIGPILFLSLPATAEGPSPDQQALAEAQAAAAEILTDPLSNKPVPGQSGLGLAAAAKIAKSEPTITEGAVYKRGDHTFNRRFFETKFPGFFRVVPGEAEKDLVIVVKAVKQEYVAKRISRISSNEMHLQLLRGGGNEVCVSFGEIVEVQIRRQDAKA